MRAFLDYQLARRPQREEWHACDDGGKTEAGTAWLAIGRIRAWGASAGRAGDQLENHPPHSINHQYVLARSSYVSLLACDHDKCKCERFRGGG